MVLGVVGFSIMQDRTSLLIDSLFIVLTQYAQLVSTWMSRFSRFKDTYDRCAQMNASPFQTTRGNENMKSQLEKLRELCGILYELTVHCKPGDPYVQWCMHDWCFDTAKRLI
jgi:hypothetical protein